MNFDTPIVEYLIIGTHSMSWLIVLFMALLKIPLDKLTKLGPEAVLLALPFAYLIGMICDSTVQPILEVPRKRIKAQYLSEDNKYKDEFIALKSPDLYNAYDARVRRVRILGTAIFNWPLLVVSLIVYFGFAIDQQFIVIFISGILLTLLSASAWRSLYHRAYKFRKNACDVIAAQDSIMNRSIPAKLHREKKEDVKDL